MRRTILSSCRVILMCVVAILAISSTSRAGESSPLIAELIEYEDVRAVIPPSTFEVFTQTFTPTPEQRTAAADLIAAARNDLARVINRHLRTVRDDASFEQLKASEVDVVRNAGVVERQMLEDLRALLTPEQSKQFAAFERAHRRVLTPAVSGISLPMDLPAFFARNSFDPRSDERLLTGLEKFDIDRDAALVRERKAWIAYFENVRAAYDNSPEGQARREQLNRERDRATLALLRVNVSSIQPVLDRLPEALRDTLVLEIVNRSAQGFDRSVASPDGYPVVREVLALNLTRDQRDEAKKVVDAAKAEILSLARRCVVEQAAFDLADNAAREKYPTAPLNTFWGDASKVRKRTSAAMLALLTPIQRNLYDASEVLDPSESSKVKPSP
jgi:hypothetical protein